MTKHHVSFGSILSALMHGKLSLEELAQPDVIFALGRTREHILDDYIPSTVAYQSFHFEPQYVSSHQVTGACLPERSKVLWYKLRSILKCADREKRIYYKIHSFDFIKQCQAEGHQVWWREWLSPDERA